MQREFKFRIWKSDKKQWIDLASKDRRGFYPLAASDYTDSNCFTVQQYTGLKTYQTKDIYEGDIFCYCQWHVNELGLVRKNEFFGEVVFDIINDIDDYYSPYVLGWGVKSNDGRITSLKELMNNYEHHDGKKYNAVYSKYGGIIDQRLELVGNIFETPNLLQ